MSTPATPELIETARQKYEIDRLIDADDIEIDDNATMSVGEDGAWVSAWVWISQEQTT